MISLPRRIPKDTLTAGKALPLSSSYFRNDKMAKKKKNSHGTKCQKFWMRMEISLEEFGEQFIPTAYQLNNTDVDQTSWTEMSNNTNNPEKEKS